MERQEIDLNDVYFVYVKNDNVKVLNGENARIQHDKLIKSNWTHKHTLNAITFIEYIFKHKINETFLN